MHSVTMQNASKLNQLQRLLPEGLVVDAAWLTAHGYSSALRSQYVQSGWLNSPTRRVYRRGQGPLNWEMVIRSLQHVLRLPLTVGGRTALEQQGYAHYLSTEQREVHLYGPMRPPTWLSSLPLNNAFRWHNADRLFPHDSTIPEPASATPETQNVQAASLILSSRERAVLELLDELPDHESFDQVDALMEGLVDLSPRRLQTALERCASVKVKRLFCFFADRHGHGWRKHLDLTRIDLGSGKRLLVKGGRLDPTHLITVPSSLMTA
jgi:hypothetical protein